MPANDQDKLSRKVASIIRNARRRGVRDDQTLDFIRAFYAEAVLADIEAYSIGDLVGLALEAWRFIDRRPAGRPAIRIYEPKRSRVRQTVLEICNDDMPFLVDSVMAELAERGLDLQLVLHPIIRVKRDRKGRFSHFFNRGEQIETSQRESLIHIHFNQVLGKMQREALVGSLRKILADVRTVVLDWPLMRNRLAGAIAGFQSCPPPVPVDELAETIQFLQWLDADHFLFLGMREFEFRDDETGGELREIGGSGIGILRNSKVKVLRRGRDLVTMTPEVREFLMQPAPLIITKANVRATVHRRAHMDYIGIKQFDERGVLTGELRIVGLFTASAYTNSISSIPFLRRKTQLVLERSGHDLSSHIGRALLSVLNSYPRDELFQIGVDKLYEIAIGILQLYERPRTRLFVRRDRFDRFVSALVFVSKDYYDTSVRLKIGDILCRAYDGQISAYFPSFPEGPLARVHYIIGRYEGVTPTPDLVALEEEIARAARSWTGNLIEALSEQRRQQQIERYRNGFPRAYQDTFSIHEALDDLVLMDGLDDATPLVADFGRREEDGPDQLHLKLFHKDRPIALSDRLPILENMGFRSISERTYRLGRAGKEGRETIWYHDIALERLVHGDPALDEVAVRLRETFLAVWAGKAEDDPHNALAAAEGMTWRQIMVLRACTHYLRQTGIAYSRGFMARVLVRHGALAAQLSELFHVRFDPDRGQGGKEREAAATAIAAAYTGALEQVSSLDEDVILRRYLNLVQVMLRTNYFIVDAGGNHPAALAFKIDSRKVDDLPRPRPLVEIFVCSPRMQGVHLRGGRIARGGIRWSDRPEDFRTEILGLMKAQLVKNAVIVPLGAKGGFYPRRLAADAPRDEAVSEAIACYRIFITSLLDLTDNLGTPMVPQQQVIRYDEDDPYLVVAADKGTAAFSDIANDISLARGFWLGDAFASGGSAGYDHKKMGITARGAWEAVKRHFREMGRDIQRTPFTVIGVGDMSGDVFGNGMLLSAHIRLVAAFDHRDIFIDPDPDEAKALAERRRLFELPRSSWQDYDSSLISAGGGVFSRKRKSIALSAPMKALTGLDEARVTPNRLIHALLKADVDLLWFGGIGTYVRASTETDMDAGDRANDAVRVTAPQLRARVVGEGANLGLTQRARVEYARAGGRLNTDAIDNSAGVNTSDIEVNIKIALGSAIADRRLKPAARNRLLARMTGSVARLVLANNYNQTLAITLEQARGVAALGVQERAIHVLEQHGHLDRALEFLPDESEIRRRRKQGLPLTRPEIAVILAFAKIALFDELLNSGLPDDDYFTDDLIGYFPPEMRRRFEPYIRGHRLHREIIATLVCNDLVNQGGPGFAVCLVDETRARPAAIAEAYVMVRAIFGLPALFDAVDALDERLQADMQNRLYLELQDILHEQTLWYLRNASPESGISEEIEQTGAIVKRLNRSLAKILPADICQQVRRRETRLTEQGLAPEAARAISILSANRHVLDIIHVARETGRKPVDAGRVFFALGEALGIHDLLAGAAEAPANGYFDRLAFDRIAGETIAEQRRLTGVVLMSGVPVAKALERWFRANELHIERVCGAISDLTAAGPVTLARLTVINGYLHDLG